VAADRVPPFRSGVRGAHCCGVDRVFRLAGAEAVYAHHPMQRCFRDVHAAGQHILFSARRDQAFAKVRLGIDQPAFLI
jgi:hypothetical protein